MTLACEDAYSKLVGVVTVADVIDKDRVGNSLLQIWKLRFGHKAKLLLFVPTLSTRFGQYFDVRVQGRFSIFPLMFCRGYDVESRSRFKALFGRYFEVYVQSRC